MAELTKNVDHFSRQSVLEHAALPIPVRQGPPTPQEKQTTVGAMERIEASLELNRVAEQVGRASDDQLVERWAPMAVRNGHN